MSSRFYQSLGKRLFDLLLGGVALALALPLLLLAALLIRLRMGSPVLFRHRRPGYLGRPFTLLKLRTMTAETDELGRPLPDERRLTPLGGLLRRWSIDELPALWNVVRGDMSLVGPRPLLEEYLERYSEEQARRHEVLPGVTGWAQIHGRNATTWERRLALDVWYVDRVGFALDARILLTTAGKIFSGEGISAPGHATMPRFQGAGTEPGRTSDE